MKETAFGEWTVTVKSATETGTAKFHPGPWTAYDVESGVGFDVGVGWVVFEWADFERMYNLAKAARENDD